MALYSYGLCSCGPYSYGLCSHGTTTLLTHSTPFFLIFIDFIFFCARAVPQARRVPAQARRAETRGWDPPFFYSFFFRGASAGERRRGGVAKGSRCDVAVGAFAIGARRRRSPSACREKKRGPGQCLAQAWRRQSLRFWPTTKKNVPWAGD